MSAVVAVFLNLIDANSCYKKMLKSAIQPAVAVRESGMEAIEAQETKETGAKGSAGKGWAAEQTSTFKSAAQAA
jgi:hypothetical protein